jgi:hypothetical protein
MPAVATRTSIANAAAGVQSAAAWAAIESAMTSAGYTTILRTSDHGTGNVRSAILRPPPLDRYASRPELFWLYTTGGAALNFSYLYDYNIQQALPTTATLSGANGAWSGGTWPTTGIPLITTTINQGNLPFDGATTGDLFVLASEYGVVAVYVTTQATNLVNMVAPQYPMDPVRSRREIGFVGTLAGATATFTAPASQHLTVRIEGVDFNITFPTGVALTPYRITQEITRQLGGFGEADLRPRRTDADVVIVRIPGSRAPVAGYSTTKPEIALIYQDPTVRTAGINFAIGGDSWALTGATLASGNFNFIQHRARVGSTVYNHTLATSTTIESFNDPGTEAVLTSVVGWLSSHTVDVYPTEDHGTGVGNHGGYWQMVLEGAETADITDGADRTVILNDVYGEAQGQFEVGQRVLVSNNGLSVNLALSGVVGTFVLGEEIEVTVGGGLGTRGLIRALDGSTVSVDTIEGAGGAGSPYEEIPWQGTDTITGATSGATAAIVPTASANIGWHGYVPILAIGQVDPANGDHRTTLSLDLDHGAVNTSLALSPGSVIGVRAKTRQVMDTASTSLTQPTTVPRVVTNSTYNVDTDVNRHELDLTVEPARSPDYETDSLQIAEIVGRFNTTAGSPPYSTDLYSTYAHVRTINGRSALGPGYRDECPEDGDPNRVWVPLFEINAMLPTFSAGSEPADAVWIAVGPVAPGSFA